MISDPLSMATEGLAALCERWECSPELIRELRVYQCSDGSYLVAGETTITTTINPTGRVSG